MERRGEEGVKRWEKSAVAVAGAVFKDWLKATSLPIPSNRSATHAPTSVWDIGLFLILIYSLFTIAQRTA